MLPLHPSAGENSEGDTLELVQENDPFSAAGVSEAAVAYATVEVLTAGGRVFAFASVIDNATNDPTLVSLVVPES